MGADWNYEDFKEAKTLDFVINARINNRTHLIPNHWVYGRRGLETDLNIL